MSDKPSRFETKLLDEDTQLIVKHFTTDGYLNLDDPSLQAVIFSMSGIKEALLAEATRREAEAAKNCA